MKFALDRQEKDVAGKPTGATMRDIWNNVREQGGDVPREYVEKTLDFRLQYLWEYYQEIVATRNWTENGPSRISRLEVAQWERDEAVRLDPWERRVVLKTDALFVASFHRDIAKDT